jgi:hypothetical protein
MSFRFHASTHVASTSGRSRKIAWIAMFAMVEVILLSGCGKSNEGRGPSYPAEGLVLLDGEPVAGANVVFYPLGDANKDAKPSRGLTDSAGKFHLGTHAADDGAPAGEYVVTVIRYPMRKQSDGGYSAGANDLPKKYAGAKTTDLRIQHNGERSKLPTLALHDPQNKEKVKKRPNRVVANSE